jgi:hypothetical protein
MAAPLLRTPTPLTREDWFAAGLDDDHREEAIRLGTVCQSVVSIDRAARLRPIPANF